MDWTPTRSGVCQYWVYNSRGECLVSGNFVYDGSRDSTVSYHTDIEITNNLSFKFVDETTTSPGIYLTTDKSTNYPARTGDIDWAHDGSGVGTITSDLLEIGVPKSNKYYFYIPHLKGTLEYSEEYSADLSTFPALITITCSTPESQIYYTTDGNTPSSSSTLYSSKFTAEAGTTIKAIAIKEGMLDSDVATTVV